MLNIPNINKPRCFLVYALAPNGLSATEANERLNAYTADDTRGVALWHDHFIGRRGGTIILYVETDAQREALKTPGALEGWDVQIHPLIYSRSPSAFDEQIAYTLRAYHNQNWDQLQLEQRPHFGDPQLEAQTAEESTS